MNDEEAILEDALASLASRYPGRWGSFVAPAQATCGCFCHEGNDGDAVCCPRCE